MAVRREAKTVRLSWPTVREAGGIRGYRVTNADRTFTVTKPAVALAIARLRGNVTFEAVDRAGNIGRAVSVSSARLR